MSVDRKVAPVGGAVVGGVLLVGGRVVVVVVLLVGGRVVVVELAGGVVPVRRASAQSTRSHVLPSPAVPVTSRSVVLSVTFTVSVCVAELPRKTPSVRAAPDSVCTSAVALPPLPQESSMPTSAMNVVYRRPRSYVTSWKALVPRPLAYVRPASTIGPPSPAAAPPLWRSRSIGPTAFVTALGCRSLR